MTVEEVLSTFSCGGALTRGVSLVALVCNAKGLYLISVIIILLVHSAAHHLESLGGVGNCVSSASEVLA